MSYYRAQQIAQLLGDLTKDTLAEIAERIYDLNERIEELEADLSRVETERDELASQDTPND